MEHLSVLKAVLLGAVQGATEFLPVSSSGHLVILQGLLNVKLENGTLMAFDVCLHVGTLAALLAVFWRDIIEIILSFFGKNEDTSKHEARRLGIFLIIGTLPAVIFGLSLEDYFEELFASPKSAAWQLLVNGAILWGTRFAITGQIKLPSMKWWHAICVGIAQAVAIIPAISRSGTTIAGSLYLGMDRSFAARFSFLLAIPAIAGAAVLQLKDLTHLSADIMTAVIAGTVVSAIVGFICIKWMLDIISRGKFSWFAYYCWAAGIAAIIALHLKGA